MWARRNEKPIRATRSSQAPCAVSSGASVMPRLKVTCGQLFMDASEAGWLPAVASRRPPRGSPVSGSV